MNDLKRIELCNKALEVCQQLLDEEMYSEIHDYINKYDEWGLGIEMLIDTLSEDDIKIELDQHKLILVAMESMGLDQSDRADLLMKQVKNT